MAPCFNTVDLALVGAMGLTALIGLSRGFIRELASILAWVLAGIVTFWDIPILQALMSAHISSAFIADVVTGLLVFIIAFAIVSLVGTLCANFVRGATLSPVDRLFGICLGAAKGFFLLSCVELMAVCFVPRPEMPEVVRKSFLMPYVAEISDGIRSVLPKELQVFLNELSSKTVGSYPSNCEENSSQNSAGASSITDLPKNSEVKGSVDALLGTAQEPSEGNDVRGLAMLAPKDPQGEASGGVYTVDQKATLDRMLDVELAPVSEEERPLVAVQDPFSLEAQETVH